MAGGSVASRALQQRPLNDIEPSAQNKCARLDVPLAGIWGCGELPGRRSLLAAWALFLDATVNTCRDSEDQHDEHGKGEKDDYEKAQHEPATQYGPNDVHEHPPPPVTQSLPQRAKYTDSAR